MMTHENLLTLLAFVIYLGIMLLIGFLTFKKTRNTDDYFLGGRSVGPWFTALSAEASDMSSWLLMGLPGVAYFTGLKEAFWTAAGLLVGTYLNWLFVAKRLRVYTIHAKNSITIPEFLANRFHDKSGILKLVSSILIMVFFVVYTASGFLACGKLFNAVFGISFYTGLLIGVVVILSYTLMGGFLAVVSTDFLQGMLMFFALVITVFLGTMKAGGAATVFTNLSAIGKQFVNPFASVNGQSFGIMDIVSSLAWGLGYFGMPHILVRFMAIKGNNEIKTARHISMIWVTITMACALAVGVVGKLIVPSVYPSQSAAEAVFIDSIKLLVPTFIAGLFLCAILAASMSTADSQLLVASSAFSEDIYKALFRKKASDKEILFVSRMSVVAITLIAIFLAMNPASSIFDVVSYAWAGFGATFGPVILAAIFWKGASRNGAVAAMTSGGLTVIIWKQLSGGIFNVYELLPGFIIASVFLVVFSLLEKHKNPEMLAEFDAFKIALKDNK
ncbi:MAG: sodium/proline symporter PutP [Sphaerochaetaceae bacterium]